MGSSFRPPYGLPNPPMLPPSRQGYSSGACTQQVPDTELLPHELYPYTFPPPTYQSFRPVGVIDLPAVAATYTTIMSYTIPLGWDAVVLKVAHDFIGTGVGFTEGSGQLIWQLRINNNPVPNYGYMTTTVGSVKNMEDISPGFIVKSGQTVYYTVQNVSLVAGGTKIFAGINGFQWRIQNGKLGST